MKKMIAILLCVCLLPLPVHAQQEQLVALTFDDGPSGRFTRRLLDGLAQWDVKATFLLCGYRIEQYPKLTGRIFQEGHEIGLHGFSHSSMEKMDRQAVAQEITRTTALLPEGCCARWLRPPGGMTGQATCAAASDAGLPLLYWSLDPRDWATHDAEAVAQQVLRQVRDGDVILMHDMSDSSVDAALAIVRQLQAQGFRFVTVSELAAARGITPTPGTEYSCFRQREK